MFCFVSVVQHKTHRQKVPLVQDLDEAGIYSPVLRLEYQKDLRGFLEWSLGLEGAIFIVLNVSVL